MVLPTFTNNVLAKSFNAQFINKKNIKRYADTNVNQHKGHLEGWEFVQRAGLTGSENWVRMHLLTARMNADVLIPTLYRPVMRSTLTACCP